MVRQPGRFRRAGVQHLADEVVGKLVVAAADHEQPGAKRRLALLERGRGNQVEHDGDGQRVDRGAEHCGRPEQRLYARPGPADAGLHGGPQRLGHPVLPARQRTQHLDDEQGMAAGLRQDAPGQLGPSGRPGELRHRVRVERPHLDPAGHGGQRGVDLRVVFRPDGGQHQQPGPWRFPAEEVHELHRRLPGVLQVVHQEQHRVAFGQAAQEGPDRLEGASPLHLHAAPAGRRRAEERRDLGQQTSRGTGVLAEQPPQRACRGAGRRRPDRLHDRLQEQRPFGLVTAGPQHGAAVPRGLGGERLGQGGLPDPRLAGDRDQPRPARGRRGPRLPQHHALPVPSGQRDRSRLRSWRHRPAGAAAGEAAVLLAQDGQVQLPRLRRRVGAELAAEPLPQRLVSSERPGLFAGRGRGRHVPAVRRLIERVRGDGGLCVACRPLRVPGRQRCLGRGQPDPAQQLAHLLAGWIRPVRVVLLVDRGARGQQLVRALGRGQRHRGRGVQSALGLLAESGGGVQVHDDARAGRQPVAGPAALDEFGSQHRAQPADHGRDVLLRGGGPVVRPEDLDDPVDRDQAGPLDREQLEQRPRLPAADLAVGQLGAVPDDPERARKTQLDGRRTAD